MAKIYVGTYRKYICGSIYGEWLDLEDYNSREEFYAACKELHRDEEDPELMFQDWEDIPDALVSECSISEKFWELPELSEDERKLALDYGEHVLGQGYWEDMDMRDLLEQAEDARICSVEGWEDYAVERFIEAWGVDEKIVPYLDLDLIRRDFQLENNFGSEFVYYP